MLKSKIFIILFLISIFCIIPNLVSAENIVKQTETLDLTTHITEDKLDTHGWKWDSQTKTLTLKNANFDVAGDQPCFTFNKNDNITVIYEGMNTLKAESKSVFYGTGSNTEGTHGSLTFKSSNNGILNLEVTKADARGGFNLGNTINYAYDLNIESGTINSKGGFWIDGTMTIKGGNVNINTEDMETSLGKVNGIYALVQVNITGGNVDIKSNDSAIFVSGTSGDWDTKDDGIVISGGNLSLSSQVSNSAVVSTGVLKNKNIIINGGNITLNGEYGFYTKNGSIKVYHVDSLNTDNIKKEAFKVGEGDGNKIIFAEADYSKVEEAIARANKLNKADYKDFSAVEKAINAVIRGKNVLEQSEVDAMADAINDAIDSLELIDEPSDSANLDEPSGSDKSSDLDKLDDTPKTGINNLPAIVVIALIFSFFIISILKRKNKHYI